MTADISNLAARRAGLGIVTLARASGRPIVPIAYASSRRIDVKSWDRSTINLPVQPRGDRRRRAGRMCPRTPTPAALEDKRLVVETNLNEATARAYRIVDRRHG